MKQNKLFIALFVTTFLSSCSTSSLPGFEIIPSHFKGDDYTFRAFYVDELLHKIDEDSLNVINEESLSSGDALVNQMSEVTEMRDYSASYFGEYHQKYPFAEDKMSSRLVIGNIYHDSRNTNNYVKHEEMSEVRSRRKGDSIFEEKTNGDSYITVEDDGSLKQVLIDVSEEYPNGKFEDPAGDIALRFESNLKFNSSIEPDMSGMIDSSCTFYYFWPGFRGEKYLKNGYNVQFVRDAMSEIRISFKNDANKNLVPFVSYVRDYFEDKVISKPYINQKISNISMIT